MWLYYHTQYSEHLLHWLVWHTTHASDLQALTFTLTCDCTTTRSTVNTFCTDLCGIQHTRVTCKHSLGYLRAFTSHSHSLVKLCLSGTVCPTCWTICTVCLASIAPNYTQLKEYWVEAKVAAYDMRPKPGLLVFWPRLRSLTSLWCCTWWTDPASHRYAQSHPTEEESVCCRMPSSGKDDYHLPK